MNPDGHARGDAPDGPEQDVLVVDWPACRARGLCAELLPEHITVDEWGYPVVHGPVPARRRGLALEAVRACPHRALRVIVPASR